MTLVAGIDSSTQSCKVVIRDADSGELVREGRALHPEGTEVHPREWVSALDAAVADAGGLDDVAAIAVGAQQHGMVCLDDDGEAVRPALLWNDTRSARAATDLIDELGGGEAGRAAWVAAVGTVPVASFTVTKLRWFAEHEPGLASRAAAVCLPHDYLTWRLGGSGDVADVVTDRGGRQRDGVLVRRAGELPTRAAQACLRPGPARAARSGAPRPGRPDCRRCRPRAGHRGQRRRRARARCRAR